jgi:hypothetical protein
MRETWTSRSGWPEGGGGGGGSASTVRVAGWLVSERPAFVTTTT